MFRHTLNCGLRDFVIFLAGAEFFHTISHLILPYFVTMPVDLRVILLTSTMNIWIVIINGLLTILLLWWAAKLGRYGCETK